MSHSSHTEGHSQNKVAYTINQITLKKGPLCVIARHLAQLTKMQPKGYIYKGYKVAMKSL